MLEDLKTFITIISPFLLLLFGGSLYQSRAKTNYKHFLKKDDEVLLLEDLAKVVCAIPLAFTVLQLAFALAFKGILEDAVSYFNFNSFSALASFVVIAYVVTTFNRKLKALLKTRGVSTKDFRLMINISMVLAILLGGSLALVNFNAIIASSFSLRTIVEWIVAYSTIMATTVGLYFVMKPRLSTVVKSVEVHYNLGNNMLVEKDIKYFDFNLNDKVVSFYLETPGTSEKCMNIIHTKDLVKIVYKYD